MNQKTRSNREAYWNKIVLEANSSGMLKKDWCSQNGISIRRFYYWQKRIRESKELPVTLRTDDPSSNKEGGFFEVPSTCISDSQAAIGADLAPSPDIDMVLQAGGYRLYIGPRTSEQTLRMALSVICHA